MDEEIKIQGNIDINQALKEFEIKASHEQVIKTVAPTPSNELPKVVKLVMKASGGAIKEQKQAEYVLLVFVIIALVISMFLFFGGGPFGPAPRKAISPAQMREIMHLPPQ